MGKTPKPLQSKRQPLEQSRRLEARLMTGWVQIVLMHEGGGEAVGTPAVTARAGQMLADEWNADYSDPQAECRPLDIPNLAERTREEVSP